MENSHQFTSEHHELFNDSLERCRQDPGFMDRFHEVFLASSEDVRRHFEGVDLKKTRGMIQSSLPFLLVANTAPSALAKTAHSHRQMDIEPELYEVWLDAMLQAVEQTDPEFDARIAQAWRVVVSRGIDFMKRA